MSPRPHTWSSAPRTVSLPVLPVPGHPLSDEHTQSVTPGTLVPGAHVHLSRSSDPSCTSGNCAQEKNKIPVFSCLAGIFKVDVFRCHGGSGPWPPGVGLLKKYLFNSSSTYYQYFLKITCFGPCSPLSSAIFSLTIFTTQL